MPLYTALDPRATAILSRMEENFGWIPALDLAHDIIQAARDAVGLGPNIDFALATMCRALSLPEAEPFAVPAIKVRTGAGGEDELGEGHGLVSLDLHVHVVEGQVEPARGQ